jgi:hypothetical protein
MPLEGDRQRKEEAHDEASRGVTPSRQEKSQSQGEQDGCEYPGYAVHGGDCFPIQYRHSGANARNPIHPSAFPFSRRMP